MLGLHGRLSSGPRGSCAKACPLATQPSFARAAVARHHALRPSCDARTSCDSHPRPAQQQRSAHRARSTPASSPGSPLAVVVKAEDLVFELCDTEAPSASSSGALSSSDSSDSSSGSSSSSSNSTGSRDIEYDEETKTVRVPLAALEGASRRTRMVSFTCNQCGGRTTRLVNPLAWDKGLVFCQCQQCKVWHTLAANNPAVYEEVLYDKAEAATIRAAIKNYEDDPADPDQVQGATDGEGAAPAAP